MLVKKKKTKMGQSCQVSVYVCMYLPLCFAVTFHSVLLSLLFVTFLQSCCSAKLHVSGSCELVGLQVMGATEFG
jgi:hypothetical protein